SSNNQNITNTGSQLSFHDINYKVNIEKSLCKKTEVKQILYEITGIFKPGMNAIMGPSGSGKSTLLKILAGRVNRESVEGCVLVDGMNQPSNFRCMAGFVAQDGTVVGTLTVRENLMFSANLRLPKSFSGKEKNKKVDEIIYELGLTLCADSRIGANWLRGISGGERKRTNIGMELVISPKVLFLDEPTTGLDSSTAFAVMSLLNKISKNGRTIIFSIHQPRYKIFKLFDGILLLGAGRTIYHGPANKTLQYFNSIGYVCDEHENPSNFFLDIVNGDSTAIQALFNRNGNKNGSSNANDPSKPLVLTLAENFSNSPYGKKMKQEASKVYESYYSRKTNGSRMKHPDILYATSFLTQFRYVSQRTIQNIIRNPSAMLLQVTIMFFFGLFVGILFFQLGHNFKGAIQNRTGALFFITLNQIFSNLSSVGLFALERKIFIHESVGGFYRISAYFFSKYLCDLVPMRIVPLIFFSVTVYYMIGFQLEIYKFLLFFLILGVSTTSGATIGFAVSSSLESYSSAHLCLLTIFVCMEVFGGFLLNLTTMSEWLSWLQYLSLIRYTLKVGIHLLCVCVRMCVRVCVCVFA
ncbi:hypothetical protein HELRODRAFT_80591, partial [Helobdella robusta]|uniref:ABC transporter domain-containing protein n=1 Tax=Helobdella robusta TaxID=6412 RepID=T1G423_HELRO